MTTWNLDGDYVSGPLRGDRDQHLIPLRFHDDETTVYIAGPQDQEVWRLLTSVKSAPRAPARVRPVPPSAPTPTRAPTPA